MQSALPVVLRTDAIPPCVGAVCARPLTEVDAGPVWSARGRLGAMVHLLTATLPGRDRHLVLRGDALLPGDDTPAEAAWPAPGSARVLRAPAGRPGRVVGRPEPLRRVWPGRGADAVEAAVTRLRAALGPCASLIRTVPERGHRMAAGPGGGTR
ncbi:hypothetical protein ACWERF_20245 [Streptomyces griseoluteus]